MISAYFYWDWKINCNEHFKKFSDSKLQSTSAMYTKHKEQLFLQANTCWIVNTVEQFFIRPYMHAFFAEQDLYLLCMLYLTLLLTVKSRG